MKRATDGKGALRRMFAPSKVAVALSVHKRTVLRMVERRELEAYCIRPGCIRIPESEVERLLGERSIGRAV